MKTTRADKRFRLMLLFMLMQRALIHHADAVYVLDGNRTDLWCRNANVLTWKQRCSMMPY